MMNNLLKYIFIYVGDIDRAKHLLSAFSKTSQNHYTELMSEQEKQDILIKNVIKGCRKYTKSFSYQKERFMKLITIELFEQQKPYWKKLNHLPVSQKEIATCYFVISKNTTILSRLLDLPPGTVISKVNTIKKRLKLPTDFSEQQFIHNISEELLYIEDIELKDQINLTPITKSTSKKLILLKFILPVFVVAIIITGIKLNQKENQMAKEQEPTEIAEEITNPIVFAPEQHVEITEDLLKIQTYIEFYNRQGVFYTQKEAKIIAVQALNQYIKQIEYANKHNIYLTEEDHKRVIEMSDSYITYFNQFSISDEDIDLILEFCNVSEDVFKSQYLYLINLADMYQAKLGVNAVSMQNYYEQLYSDSIPNELYELIGISEQDVIDFQTYWSTYSHDIITEQPEGLPFDITGSNLKTTISSNGEIKFEYPTYFSIYGTKYSTFYDKTLEQLEYKMLSKQTIDEFIEFYDTYSSSYDVWIKYSKELALIFKTLKNSIELELQF